MAGAEEVKSVVRRVLGISPTPQPAAEEGGEALVPPEAETPAVAVEAERAPPEEAPEEEEVIPLEMVEIKVGRFHVPEDADDMLGLAHRMPGVVHVWLNGSTLCLECEPGSVDRDALVERLRDDGYPVR